MTQETKTCPRCGTEAAGNFCPECGAALTRGPCPECGEIPSAGARFCNHCGAALHGGAPAASGRGASPAGGPAGAPAGGRASAAGGARGGGDGGDDGGGNIAWWVAGALLVALILVAAYPIYAPDRDESPPAGTAGPAAGGTGSAGPLNMSMEEAAYRLFVRVMTAADTADTATVEQFRPMAISAYEQTAPLSEDARYHMALIHQAAGDHRSALEAAETGLDESSDHLLLLSAAGDAALALGDTAAALERFRHLLEVYDAEMASDRVEYVDHGAQMPEIRQRARDLVENAS